MSKYTTELRYICEYEAGCDESKGYNDVNDIVTAAAPKIFANFPIFDENYRIPLETKILKHYYTREIAAETVGLFKLWLDTKMSEIMPYYNKLYESELLKFDPLTDVDLKTNKAGTNLTNENSSDKHTAASVENENRNTESTANANSTEFSNETANTINWNKFSATPQGSISDLEADRYLTNATKVTNDDTSENFTNSTNVNDKQDTESRNRVSTDDKNIDHNKVISNIDDYIENIKGKRGGTSYSKMLEEFRATFLNIDLMIIEELKDLFFKLW